MNRRAGLSLLGGYPPSYYGDEYPLMFQPPQPMIPSDPSENTLRALRIIKGIQLKSAAIEQLSGVAFEQARGMSAAIVSTVQAEGLPVGQEVCGDFKVNYDFGGCVGSRISISGHMSVRRRRF